MIEGVLKRLEPEVLEPSLASDLVQRFSKLERLVAAGKTLATRQVERTGVWQNEGDRSAAHWVARKTGTTVGNAIHLVETAKQLAELPATEQAVREGKLSEVQAKEIASAAAASPSSENDLLDAAGREGVKLLQERCAKVKAAALKDNDVSRYRAIHKKRYFRHYSDYDGAFRFEGRLTADAGAALIATLDPIKKKMMEHARRQGSRESSQAHAADALIHMAEHVKDCPQIPTQAGPRASVQVRVDHSALIRGSCIEGETCEIPGIGPIPVATARALTEDAFLSVIVTDGADVRAVANHSRNIPAVLRTAVEARDPVCVRPGCGTRERLEIDHIDPFGQQGPTRLSNLARLCKRCHDQKTYEFYKLSGRPGAWVWQSPEEVRATEQRPPPE